jgi:hypothetical protein
MPITLDSVKQKLQQKVFNVDGLTVTIGGVILIALLVYLVFVKKILK